MVNDLEDGNVCEWIFKGNEKTMNPSGFRQTIFMKNGIQRIPILIGLCLTVSFVLAQRPFRGVIADSLSKQPLPFATIRFDNPKNAVITGIDGHFSISIQAGSRRIVVSYVGYFSKTVSIEDLKDNDTVFLVQSKVVLSEVVVLPQTEKIRRIINSTIRNKDKHNPEMYDFYQCNVYYKMHVDLIFSETKENDPTKPFSISDTLGSGNVTARLSKSDSSLRILMENKHVAFSETYSTRTYKKPMQLQEDIIASRFSGLKKTYFTNLVTNVLPFHVYSDYISLNGKDYINPIAKGWQQRYNFQLVDEIFSEGDTVFILSFRAKKNVVFNSLKGVVYINSDGYAISHFISNSSDSSGDRESKIEQIYSRINGKWFPKELNYDLLFKKYPSPQMGIRLNGHSIIDSVSFMQDSHSHFNKARSVTLEDSVDLHSEKDWQKVRPDTATTKEMNTYHFMDSLGEKVKLDGIVNSVGKLSIGRLALGIIDLDIARLVAINPYEGTRLGIGGFTNDRLSSYYSIGTWAGYGLRDKAWKYGASLTLFPGRNNDNSISFSYQENYQSVGNVYINPDLDKNWLRVWLLSEVDRINEYSLTGHTQKGYWGIEMNAKMQELQSLYNNNFEVSGKMLTTYNVYEGSVGIKYAYAQMRVPLFGYYLPYTSSFPIVYVRASLGNISSGTYSADYVRSTAAITYVKHFNRWGNDNYRLEGGIIHSFVEQPLSRSFLLAGRGFRNDQFNYFAVGGFLTMYPYNFFSDRYISFMYKHDFDKLFWQLSFSQPFISFIHNLMYGGLTYQDKVANSGILSPTHGYHESGILINQLLQYNYFHFANIYLNTGPFYHWSSPFDLRKNLIWVVGISAGF